MNTLIKHKMTPSPESSRKDIIYIEFLRVIAAFFVLVNHTVDSEVVKLQPSQTWFSLVTYLHISKIAVPVFLMIMGALLLDKKDSTKKYIMRMVRFVLAALIFSTATYFIKTDTSAISFMDFAKKLFYAGTTNAYWYLYLYLGILVILPILQCLAAALSKRELQLFLIISVVLGGTLQFVPYFIDIKIDNVFLSILFSPYLGQLFLGYYIEKYVKITKRLSLIAAGTFGLVLIVQVFLTLWRYNVDSSYYFQFYNRVSLNVTIISACVYIISKYIFTTYRVPQTLSKAIVFCGDLTFGIYLTGDIFLKILSQRVLAPLRVSMDILPAIFIFEIVVFICCGICTFILKKVPYLKGLL